VKILIILKMNKRFLYPLLFLIALFFLLWVELAVGVFGSPIAGD